MYGISSTRNANAIGDAMKNPTIHIQAMQTLARYFEG